MKTKTNADRITLAWRLFWLWVLLGVAFNLMRIALAPESPFTWWPMAIACYHYGRISVITEEPACAA